MTISYLYVGVLEQCDHSTYCTSKVGVNRGNQISKPQQMFVLVFSSFFNLYKLLTNNNFLLIAAYHTRVTF